MLRLPYKYTHLEMFFEVGILYIYINVRNNIILSRFSREIHCVIICVNEHNIRNDDMTFTIVKTFLVELSQKQFYTVGPTQVCNK